MVKISGGFFAGKISSLTQPIEGRFDPNSGTMGTMYRARYLNDGYLEALKLLKDVAVSNIIPHCSLTNLNLHLCRKNTHSD